jgi:hypothetical protein
MDNLQQDEQGVLSLVRGLKKVNTNNFSDYVNDLYAKQIGGQEVLWAGLNSQGRSVLRSKSGDFSDAVIVSSGNDRTVFGDCLGEVLVFNGISRKKDNGTVIQDLGLQTPGIPSLSAVSQPTVAYYAGAGSPFVTQRIIGQWVLQEGHGSTQVGGGADGINLQIAFSTLRGIALLTDFPGGGVDTTNIGDGPAVDPSTDTFKFQIQPDDSSQVTSVRLDAILSSDITNITDYYTVSFSNSDLLPGLAQISTLGAVRGDFTRVGINPLLDWKSVKGFFVTVECTAQMTVVIGFLQVTGGIAGVLNGNYKWIQLNKNNNGTYVAKSPPGASTVATTIINGFVTLTPAPAESQVTDIEFYRISVDNSVTNSILNDYYLVAATKPGVPVKDLTSDVLAIRTNIVLNRFLLSVQPLTDSNGIQDTIFGVEGLFNERMIYMGISFIYLSDTLDPDAVDSRYTLKAFGDPSEKNLWVKRLTNNVLVLGTSKNLYELGGTWNPLPDGTIDVTIRAIGENYPPLSSDVASTEGAIFYVAADGVRVCAGSNSQLISPQLNLLFQGSTRSFLTPIAIVTSNNARYSLAVGKTKLYVRLPNSNGDSYLFVYDLIYKRWRLQFTDPIVVYVTPTDRVLCGYNIAQGTNFSGQIFELDKGTGVTDTGGNLLEGLSFQFLTVFDANQQPRNRKDTFTLKIVADTGGKDCAIYLGKDGIVDGSNNYVYSKLNADNSINGNINSNGETTFYLLLHQFTLGFRYSIKIVDVNLVTTFKLYEITIEYDPRPEQVNYLLIPPTNLGSFARKRVTNYAFIIDTLGNNITFTPLIDNSNGGILPAQSTVNTPTKQTYIHYYTQEQIGTDFNGILSGGVFEFYSLNLEEIVSEKLPTPVEFLVIPNNDYGTPDRKRHSSYKFQINTRGKDVQFTPKLDGTFGQPIIYNTIEKRVREYFFLSDTIAIEVGGTLKSLSTNPVVPFEFYGVVIPEHIEKLPPRLEYFRIPNTNYEIAAPKRIRTLPVIIDTYGKRVRFEPIVDGIIDTINPTIFVSSGRTTLFHYFITDSFGTDYGGQLTSLDNQPFEFYALGEQERVEILPVAKKFDQLGPMRFDKIGKIFAIRLRLIPLLGLNSIPWFLIDDPDLSVTTYGAGSLSGNLAVNSGFDQVYEIQMPKSINTTMMRFVLGPASQPFCRYDMQVKVSMSGMETDSHWVPMR